MNKYIENMSFYKLLIVLIMFNSQAPLLKAKEMHNKIMKIDSFEVCELPADSPYTFDYLRIEHIQQYTLVNMKFTINRDLDSDALGVELVVKRCASKEALDSCERFTDIRPQNICSFIKLKGTAWTPWIDSYTPRYSCPIKKGTYVQRNGSIDMNILKIFPLEGYYWDVVFKLKERNKLLYSFCGGFRIGYV